MSLKRIIVAVLLAFIGFMFIVGVTPEIESVNTENITNPLTLTLMNMAIWLLPVGALIGVFYGIFRLFSGGGKGG